MRIQNTVIMSYTSMVYIVAEQINSFVPNVARVNRLYNIQFLDITKLW